MESVEESLLAEVRAAAREAGRIQLKNLMYKHHIDYKGRYNLVTRVDRKCEDRIIGRLEKRFPHIPFLAEESAPDLHRTDLREHWIIDPLDGTTNFTHGYPAFCTSIALSRDAKIVLGVVYEPVRDELFEAVLGQGARLNGKSIHVSDNHELSRALLATGFPYDRCEQPHTNLDRFCAMTMRTQGVRRGGSAALDLCYTACGRLDGFWEIRLSIWDVSAGALIVQEADGLVTDLHGGPFDGTGMEIVASNRKIHKDLVHNLNQPHSPGPCYG